MITPFLCVDIQGLLKRWRMLGDIERELLDIVYSK